MSEEGNSTAGEVQVRGTESLYIMSCVTLGGEVSLCMPWSPRRVTALPAQSRWRRGDAFEMSMSSAVEPMIGLETHQSGLELASSPGDFAREHTRVASRSATGQSVSDT
jgi:hypothetical protein